MSSAVIVKNITDVIINNPNLKCDMFCKEIEMAFNFSNSANTSGLVKRFTSDIIIKTYAYGFYYGDTVKFDTDIFNITYTRADLTQTDSLVLLSVKLDNKYLNFPGSESYNATTEPNSSYRYIFGNLCIQRFQHALYDQYAGKATFGINDYEPTYYGELITIKNYNGASVDINLDWGDRTYHYNYYQNYGYTTNMVTLRFYDVIMTK